ncbi:MAG TPA: hypothetical protein VGJ77_19150 [Gaiellaceae bacterium]|jgi:hypothetical protein
MSSPFFPVFVAGAGALALWIDARFPGLAPESFSRRVLAAVAAAIVLQAAPLFGGSAEAVYATVFAVVLPALVASLLTAVWLLRFLRDARAGA